MSRAGKTAHKSGTYVKTRFATKIRDYEVVSCDYRTNYILLGLPIKEKTLSDDTNQVQSRMERACALTDYKVAGALDTLAAAYAAARNFEKAVTTAGKAIRTAEGEGQMQLAEEIRKKLALSKKGLPYYEKARQ